MITLLPGLFLPGDGPPQKLFLCSQHAD